MTPSVNVNVIKNPIEKMPVVQGIIPVKQAQGTFLDNLQDVREGIKQTSKVIDNVNPLSYLTTASQFMEEQTHVNGPVKYVNIIYTIFVILSWIFWIASMLVSGFIWLFITIFTILVQLSIFITPFLPILLFIALFFMVTQAFWDEVTTPFLEKIFKGYNGVITQWNKITDSVRNIGFYVPLRILGKDVGFRVNLGGIDLPHGKKISPTIEPFWSYVENILWIAILNPLIKSTDGTIFRK